MYGVPVKRPSTGHVAHARQKRREAEQKFGHCVGAFAQNEGDSAAARLFGVTVDTARYWKRKVGDPTFHPGTWGGPRVE